MDNAVQQIEGNESHHRHDSILDQIHKLDLEIQQKYENYHMLQQAVELHNHDLIGGRGVSIPYEEPLKLRFLRWLAEKPMPKFTAESPNKKVRITETNREDMLEQLDESAMELNRLIGERESLFALLDNGDRAKLESNPQIPIINEAIQSRVAQILAEQETILLPEKNESEYSAFVDGLKIPDDQKEKLKEVIEGYDVAVTTAKELDPNIQIPSKESVIAHIIALGESQMEKIAKVMTKPALIIVPAKQTLRELTESMDRRAHLKGQKTSKVYDDRVWSGRRKKVEVSIVDMVQHAEPIPGHKPSKQYGYEQYAMYEKYYEENGLRMIKDYEYAVALHRSLVTFAQACDIGINKPTQYILDFYLDEPTLSDKNSTTTMLSVPDKSGKNILDRKMGKIGCGYYHVPVRNQPVFNWVKPKDKYFALRGRAAISVM